MRISILGKIIDLLFPRFCPICRNRLMGEEEGLCLACNLHLPRTDTWENPYENEMAKMFWHQIPIEKCGALFYYASHAPASNILYKLKYNYRPDIGVFMGKMLAEEGLRNHFFDGIDAIVPIPISPSRRKKRGYNQSEEIAKGISMLTHIPVVSDMVARTLFKGSQTDKDRWERMDNVENVFTLTKDYQAGGKKAAFIAGKHLLIVDDVCTTGATILSCCKRMSGFEGTKFSVATIGYTKK